MSIRITHKETEMGIDFYLCVTVCVTHTFISLLFNINQQYKNYIICTLSAPFPCLITSELILILLKINNLYLLIVR